MDLITIKEILEYMETGKPFSMTVVSYNRKKADGGELITYGEACLYQSKVSGRPKTRLEEARERVRTAGRDPKHRHHYTRNILLMQDGKNTSLIKKIHPPLVISFNGMTVTP